jgi:hypothetical protein
MRRVVEAAEIDADLGFTLDTPSGSGRQEFCGRLGPERDRDRAGEREPGQATGPEADG